MYRYKRGVNNLEQAKLMEYSYSNNIDTCFCMSGALDARKPYNGMYIKDGKVILENLIEEIEIKDKLYKIAQINTSFQNVSCDEYITNIDLENNLFNYDFNGISFSKKIAFEQGTDVLCFEYEMVNKQKNNIKFRISPLITYRELFNMKTSQTLRFNQRKVDNGFLLNLSIMNEQNLVVKSDVAGYVKEARILTNVKHEYLNDELKKEIFQEDLFLPGYFEIELKSNQTKKFYIYVSTKDFSINGIDPVAIFQNENFKNERIKNRIEKEYIELTDLAIGVNNLVMNDSLISSLPYQNSYNCVFEELENYSLNKLSLDISNLTDITRAIDGVYLTFDRIDEANKVLIRIRRYIREFDRLNSNEFLKEKAILKLWYIESVNRLIQKQSSYIEIYIEFVREILYEILSEERQAKILSDIKSCALCFNAIKIYENMLSKIGHEDIKMHDIGICIQNLITNKYWDDEKRAMKKNIEDETAVPNIDMIYTLSLSYPCVTGNISIKLLDTVFKELYTPYGLRITPKSSLVSNGNIYPKYMAHFIKANLRQNGVTRASQKIAFNLVKELIQDINKYVNGGIRKIYNDRGIAVDTVSYDLLTNAEVIRLYDMLT